MSDIKQWLLDKAGSVVSGARRKAYGTPENNFARIALFWDAYFVNCGVTLLKNGQPYTLQASDVSPLMRLMKEARLCETPDHTDSFTDLIGYTLTGAEVNKAEPIE